MKAQLFPLLLIAAGLIWAPVSGSAGDPSDRDRDRGDWMKRDHGDPGPPPSPAKAFDDMAKEPWSGVFLEFPLQKWEDDDRRGFKLFRGFMQMRMEAARLVHEGEMLDRREEEYQEVMEKEGVDEEHRERLERILKLREELLDLEKKEFVDRVHKGSGKVLETIRERIKEGEQNGDESDDKELKSLAFAKKMEDHVSQVYEASTDFESLIEVLRKHDRERGGDPSSSKMERLEKEIQMLGRRIEHLRDQLERMHIRRDDKEEGRWRWDDDKKENDWMDRRDREEKREHRGPR